MSNLLNYLILGTIFGLTKATYDTSDDNRVLTNHTLAVEVEVDLPWFVLFKIPLFEDFDPLRFSVSVSRPGVANPRPVGFNAHNETEKRRIFRNTDPLRLYDGDVIYGVLRYMGDLQKPRPETELKQVDFTYVIGKKQFDTIPIVVQVLTDPRKKHDEEYDDFDCGEENTTEDDSDDAMNNVNSTRTSTEHWQKPAAPATCTSAGNEEGYTAELLKTAVEIGQIGTRLLLTGKRKPPGNAVDVIKTFIMDKLRLPHLAEKVLQARFINSTLLFEMATPHAKLEVLTKARLCLRRNRRIESTQLNFTDTYTST